METISTLFISLGSPMSQIKPHAMIKVESLSPYRGRESQTEKVTGPTGVKMIINRVLCLLYWVKHAPDMPLS